MGILGLSFVAAWGGTELVGRRRERDQSGQLEFRQYVGLAVRFKDRASQ